MDSARVATRGLNVHQVEGARLFGYRLLFDKISRFQTGAGHANVERAPGHVVEGVVYRLASSCEIVKMDPYESAPDHYRRVLVDVIVGTRSVCSWTYIANDSVRRTDLRPPRWYVNHLLAARKFLSDKYIRELEALECLM